MAAVLVRDLRANLSLGMSDDEFNRGMEGLKANAPKQGDAVAGAFSKAFSRQLGQAFRTLPKAQIDANTSDADLKVNTLRESLRDLANKRIGVDIAADTAIAEMRAIKAELESLQETADIAVRADVSKALAALGVVEHQVEELDGRSVDIDVDVHGAPQALAKVGLIDTALTALEASGPLKVAAVGAAIAALPVAAGIAAEGVTFLLGGALAAVGLAASQGSATAQAAIARLKTSVQREALEIGEPFERVWVRIVDVAQRELDQLGPHVRDSLADLAPDVEAFADQAGASLGQLTPAIDGVQRAASAMLQDLGPALPDAMHNLTDGVTALTDAVAENPEVLTRMVQGLAAFAEWAGNAAALGVRLAKVVQDNSEAALGLFHVLAPLTLALRATGLGTVDVGDAADDMTSATLRSADAAGVLDARLSGLMRTYGLVGDEGATAAQQLMASWSQTFQSMTSASTVMQQIQTQTRATIADQERQAAARERLADVEEQAAARIAQAHQRVTDAKRRAADDAEQSDRRVAASRAAVTTAEEQAADRVASAARQVEDARRRAAQTAEDAGRRIEDAAQRVEDSERDAADHEVDASRRVQDAHARTLQAVEDLTEARTRAREQLEDLARAESASALDVEAAEIALERARERRDQVNNDTTSSPLDRHEADLAFRQAQARLEDVKRRAAELRTQIQAAAQAGVEGSAVVMQASARVADAQEAERDASAALARQRIDDAKAVADAQQALAEAQQDAARQQEDSQRSLAQAEAELTQARVEGAASVVKAKQEVSQAQRDAAKSAKDAARDVAEAAAAEAKARQDAARDIVKAHQEVRESFGQLGGAAHVTTEQFLAELERQVKNTEEWADNLVKLSERVPAEMVERLRALGPGSADVVAMAAGMTDKELKKFIDLMGRSGKDSGDQFSKRLADAINANPQNVKIGLDDARARVAFNKLIHDIGTAANVAISVTVGAALQATGNSADGNIYMAGGGVLSFARGSERHVAQLAMPGTRVWAEPETEGEGYIPLALSKRARSEQILSQIADRFGGAYIRHSDIGPMSVPAMGGDGTSAGGSVTIGPISLHFDDDRDMYRKGTEFAAGLREYARRGGTNPFG